ncbi:polysaccharide pyruvyl transferase family protein [Xanthobacter sp. VTT E-85241]|uniref:polysaccharide pyruvyl transferase family protein n=1 Tax=Roseixanthobacter finlandensis TaxID=3119922 RepID=UPI00372C48C9
MARVLVMIPSGEVYDHDCVRWYNYKDVQRSIDHYHNIGDAFVFDSSLKLMEFDKLGVLPIANPKMEDIDRLREDYDYVFLRGSNYVHNSMKWQHTIEVLKRLKLPVIALGIGAQAPVKGRLELSEETKTVLHMMADSSASIGVRGAYSAQVLWDIGIRNIRIVGCPTAFRKNDPNLAITLPKLEDVHHVGITCRREVSPAYAQDIKRYLTFHRDLVKECARRFDVVLMAQGEVEEKKIVFGTAEQREEAITALKANKWVGDWFLDDEIERLYRERLFYSDVVADYEALVQQKDLVLGYRLHGNLMALSNGVPSIYFTYDSRTVEFAETYQIPSYDVFSTKPFKLEKYWDQGLFDKFNRAWFMTYREMKAFLDENGVANKMADVGHKPVPVPARAAAAARKVA